MDNISKDNMIQEENNNKNTSQELTGQASGDIQETPASYAVRPQHRQRRLIDYNGRDKMFKVRNTLNILFMVLAVIGLILWTQTELQTLSTIILLVGVALKITEVCIRMFKK